MKVIRNFKRTIDVPEEGVKAEGERIEIPKMYEEEISKVLISEKCLKLRIKELAQEVCRERKEVFAVSILKGAIVFLSDLIRMMPCKVKFDLMKVSSYVGDKSSGKIRIDLDIASEIEGKDVLLVEDIVDTGLTLSYVKEYLLNEKKAKSVRICTLLDKPARREKEVRVDYVGFRIPNYFIAGFGIDYNQKFRNLPFIVVARVEK
jgi:hypoxanthine phosphoribosyltransferase